MTAQALTSLAILKVQWDERGHDYVDNFVPFLAEALRKSPTDVVSIEELQQQLRDLFRLNIPQGAIQTLLKRAERRKFVRRDRGVFIRIVAALPSDFGVATEDAARQQRALLARFVTFARDKHGVEWSEDQAEGALIAQLQLAAVPLLASASTGVAVPAAEDTTQLDIFLASSFIVHLDRDDPEGFRFLETVVKGYTLAAALFLPDIGKARQRFSNLTVFVDTRLILRAMGLEGDRFRTASVELLNLLYHMNVSLACFTVTFDEITGILDAAQHALRDPRHNTKQGLFAVYERLVETGTRASDVEFMIANLEKILRTLHIKVRPVPEHKVALGISEGRLDEALVRAMPGQRLEAKRHDIDCISAIHRLREARLSHDIENCRFVFVTTNTALARATSEFFAREYERLATPLCVTDHTMATLAWVKNPGLANDLSVHEFIAECYAALNPGNELWRKYCDEISKLQVSGEITADDYHLLRFSTVARAALLDATRGDPDAFATGTVPEILEHARANARRDVEAQLGREHAALGVAEQEVLRLREEQARRNASQLERVNGIGRGIAKLAGWLVYFAISGSVALLAIYGIAPKFLLSFQDGAELAFWGILVLGGIVTVAVVAEGGSVRAVARRIEGAVCSWAVRHVARWLAIDVDGKNL